MRAIATIFASTALVMATAQTFLVWSTYADYKRTMQAVLDLAAEPRPSSAEPTRFTAEDPIGSALPAIAQPATVGEAERIAAAMQAARVTAIITARLNACSEIGAASAEFRAVAEDASRRLDALRLQELELLRTAPIQLARSVAGVRHTLPQSLFDAPLDDLTTSASAAANAVLSGDADQVAAALTQLAAAADATQSACARLVETELRAG